MRVISLLRKVWSFPYHRHLRRARARWRLHQIEWAGRFRPLDPPKGYEKYYTEAEMFPGLKDKPTWKAKNWDERFQQLRLAWRLYRHQYTGTDEEMRRFEDFIFADYRKKEKANNTEDVDRKVEEVLKQADDVGKKVARDSQHAYEQIKKNAPAAQDMVKDRAQVTKNAVAELVKGYHEGINGKVTWASLGLDFTDPVTRDRWLHEDEREEEKMLKRNKRLRDSIRQFVDDDGKDKGLNGDDSDDDDDNPPIVYHATKAT